MGVGGKSWVGGVWLADLGISWPSAGMDDIRPGVKGGVRGVGGPEDEEAGTTGEIRRRRGTEGRHHRVAEGKESGEGNTQRKKKNHTTKNPSQ